MRARIITTETFQRSTKVFERTVQKRERLVEIV